MNINWRDEANLLCYSLLKQLELASLVFKARDTAFIEKHDKAS